MLLEQKIGFSTTIEELTSFSDVLLDEPQLVGVRAINPFTSQDNLFTDGSDICTNVGYPVYFEWYEVDDATNYILQICQHQEFVGPTLVTYNVASTEASPFTADAIYKEIFAGQALRKEKSYYWRVFALGDDGEVSPKSEIWNVNFKCEIADPNETSSDSSGSSESSSSSGTACSYRDAKIVDLEVSSGTGSASPPTLKYNVFNAEGQQVLSDVAPSFRLSTSEVNAAFLGIIRLNEDDCTPELMFAFESFQEDTCV